MENYVVSARKYRPLSFESVVGQHALTQTLKNAIHQNHLAHAYLFCGPRGVGKTTCARIFAKTINCMNPSDNHDACNECESCVAFNEQRSFNIHELDAASNNSVEDIRSLIEQVRIPPQIGKYSVYIIDEVHMLSSGAFNALLKTLEEPPSYAIFILATTEKHKVLPTILSRCQVYDFSRITLTDTIAHLQYVAKQEEVEIGEDSLSVVAHKADGGMRDALSIFDQLVSFCGKKVSYEQTIEILNVLDSDYYFRLVDMALKGDVSGSLLLLNDVLVKGFDAGHFVTGLAEHLRDVLVSKDEQTVVLLESAESIRKHYAEQAKRCSTPWLFKAMDLINSCDIQYRTARNKRLMVEWTLVRLAQLQQPAPDVAPVPVRQPVTPATPATPTPSATPAAPVAPKVENTTRVIHSLPKVSTVAESVRQQETTETAAKVETTERTSSTGNAPFTIDQFNSAWAGLRVLYKEEPRLLDMLTEYYPQQVEESVFVLTLSNPWQKEEFSRHGKRIMDHIRQELKNDSLRLRVEVQDYTAHKQAFTAEEKYKVLVEKNPMLADMKKRLNLMLE